MVEVRPACKQSSGDTRYDLVQYVRTTAPFVKTRTQDSPESPQFQKIWNLY